MVHKYGAVGGMITGRETEIPGDNQPQCHFVHHAYHKTRPDTKPGQPEREASDYPPELWHGPCLDAFI
jgi:hypothetical protein